MFSFACARCFIFIVFAQAIDVWSVGCILAELLQLLKPPRQRQSESSRPHASSSSSSHLPKKLFDRTLAFSLQEGAQDDDWQMHVNEIFKVVGSLSPSEIEELDGLKVWDHRKWR